MHGLPGVFGPDGTDGQKFTGNDCRMAQLQGRAEGENTAKNLDAVSFSLHGQAKEFGGDNLFGVCGQAHAHENWLMLAKGKCQMLADHIGLKRIPSAEHVLGCQVLAEQVTDPRAGQTDAIAFAQMVFLDDHHVGHEFAEITQDNLTAVGISPLGPELLPVNEELATAGVHDVAADSFRAQCIVNKHGILRLWQRHQACAIWKRVGVCGAATVPDRTAMTDPMPEIATEAKTPPIFNVPLVVLAVIFGLAAVHGALWVLGPDWQIYAIYLFAFIPVRLGGGEPIALMQGSQVWSFLTYAALHGDFVHLGSNCIWLLIFSTPVVKRLGTLRYLALLVVTAIAGAAAMLPMHWGQFLIVVGASAMVSGCMAAAIPIMYAPGFRRGGDVRSLTPLRPGELLVNRSAVMFTSVFVVLQLVTGSSQALGSTAFLEERIIAWEAHLGGFVAGLLCFYLFDRNAGYANE